MAKKPQASVAFNDNVLPPKGAIVPNVVDGQRTWDLYSSLMKEGRVIWLTGEVNDQSCELLKAQLLSLEMADPDKEIFIYIDSPGGSVYSGQSVANIMDHITCPIVTVVAGMAASMGSVIAAAGTPGMRFALPDSCVMVHQPSSGVKGKETEMRIAYNGISALRNRMETMYACWMGLETTKADIKLVHRLMEQDTYVNGLIAKKLGLIDDILAPKVMTPAKQKVFDLTAKQSTFEFEQIGKNPDDDEMEDLLKIIKTIVAKREGYIQAALEGKNDNPMLAYAVAQRKAELEATGATPVNDNVAVPALKKSRKTNGPSV